MQISLKLSKDHFEVPPPVPNDHIVVRDRSQSGWRLMIPDDNYPVAPKVIQLQVQTGRSPMYGHRFKQHPLRPKRRSPMRNLAHLPDAFEVGIGNGNAVRVASPDTRPDSEESWQAFEALHQSVVTNGVGQAKSVTFGGLEFPPSGGIENDDRWLD